MSEVEPYLHSLKSLREKLPAPRPSDDFFSVETFLYELDLDNLQSNEDLKINLDRIAKKVEVVKIVRLFYSIDLAKRKTIDEIHPMYANFLCGIYLLYQEQKGMDWKFFNTACQMLDGILVNHPVSYPEFFYNWLESIIAKAEK